MLGERIKQLRKERGMYQQALANALQVSKSTVAMWETDKREPDIQTIKRIAEFFCVSIDYLLGKTDQKLDDRTWDEYAAKFEAEVNAGFERDFDLMKQLFAENFNDTTCDLLHQIVMSIRTMNQDGIRKLAERADELCRLREYMNQETRDIEDEMHRLWEEEQRKKENPPTE